MQSSERIKEYKEKLKDLGTGPQGYIFTQLSRFFTLLDSLIEREDISPEVLEEVEEVFFQETFHLLDEIIEKGKLSIEDLEQLETHIFRETFQLIDKIAETGKVSLESFEALENFVLKELAKTKQIYKHSIEEREEKFKQKILSLPDKEIAYLVTNIYFDVKSKNAVTPEERRLAIRNNRKKIYKHLLILDNFRQKTKKHLDELEIEEKFEEDVKESQKRISTARNKIARHREHMHKQALNMGRVSTDLAFKLFKARKMLQQHIDILEDTIEETSSYQKELGRHTVEKGKRKMKKMYEKQKEETIPLAISQARRHAADFASNVTERRGQIDIVEMERIVGEISDFSTKIKNKKSEIQTRDLGRVEKGKSDFIEKVKERQKHIEGVDKKRFRIDVKDAKIKFFERREEVEDIHKKRFEEETEEAKGKFLERGKEIEGKHKPKFKKETKEAGERFKQKGEEIEGEHKPKFEGKTKEAGKRFLEKGKEAKPKKPEEVSLEESPEAMEAEAGKARSVIEQQKAQFLYTTRFAKKKWEDRAKAVLENVQAKNEEFKEKQKQFLARTRAHQKSKMIRSLMKRLAQMNKESQAQMKQSI